MKKVAGFLVDARIIILALFVPIVAFCLIISTKVHINDDMTQYLKDDSATKQGIAVSKDRFAPASAFSMMFGGLSGAERVAVKDKLEGYSHVKNVAVRYGEDERDENGGPKAAAAGKTLYTITVDLNANSQPVHDLSRQLKKDFKGYSYDMSGDALGNTAREIMPYILVGAVLIALVILFVLSDSWAEPILFLAVMLAAVAINMGTNIMFKSVSDITNSIAAILQMCLSMDYSIMLLTRYRQEKERDAANGIEPGKRANIGAMKRALANAFVAISASSLTTIAGMLAMCFMSFKLGMDIGLVLAKGVFLSLLCIFTLMPAIVLILDKLLAKTKKPSPPMPMGLIARFENKARYIMPALFVVLFVGGFVMRGNVNVTYTLSEFYKINRTFDQRTPIVIVYNAADEDRVAPIVSRWQDNPNIREVNAVATVISENTQKITDGLEALDAPIDYAAAAESLSVDKALTKLIYTFYENDAGLHNSYGAVQVGKLKSFIDTLDLSAYGGISVGAIDADGELAKELNKPYTFKETAAAFNISEQLAKLLYETLEADAGKRELPKLTVGELIDFIDSASKDPVIAANLAGAADLNKPLNYKDAAALFGVAQNEAKALFAIAEIAAGTHTPPKIALGDFLAFIDSARKSDPLIASYVKDADLDKGLSYKEAAAALNIDEAQAKYLYAAYEVGAGEHRLGTIQLAELLAFLKQASKDPAMGAFLSSQFNEEELARLAAASDVVLPEYLTMQMYTETVSDVMKIDEQKVTAAYILFDMAHGYEPNARLTIGQLAQSGIIPDTYLDNPMSYAAAAALLSQDPAFMAQAYAFYDVSINGYEPKTALTLPQLVSSGILPVEITDTKRTFKETAALMGMDEELIRSAFILYDISKGYEPKMTYTAQDIIDSGFVSSDYVAQATETALNKAYTPTEAAAAFGVDRAMMEAAYILYDNAGGYSPKAALSPEQLIDYILDKAGAPGGPIAAAIDELMKKELNDAKAEITKARADIAENLIKIEDARSEFTSGGYSRAILVTNLKEESDATKAFLTSVNNELTAAGVLYYIVGNAAVAYDMGGYIPAEMDKITILSALAIFIIVLIAFRSFSIPVILTLLIQSSVFITMGTVYLMGGEMYYLPVIIVQCLLMGATVDYGILYATYYREYRQDYGVRDSVIKAMNSSIHTIATSASILVLVTLLIGLVLLSAERNIAEIMLTVSRGALTSSLLAIFILPGMMAGLDRITRGRKAKK